MASLANPTGVKFSNLPVNNFSNISKIKPFILPFSTQSKRRKSAPSMALSNSPVNYLPSVSKTNNENQSEPKIDEWMEGSVTDIVLNLKQAPLLVHVYGNSEPEFRTEKAFLENWADLKTEWRNGETKLPDGLIFVEELEGEEEVVTSTTTRAWGIVVQGRGVKCGSYLLKTSRVGAGCGLGLFSTHFCLTKVTNFRESALRQLQDCWLLE